MGGFNVYNDINARTNGEIYIGVVGPVRTGKSTFIKRFMEMMVIPNIKDENDREIALDEMPQSASGKTIMTTEPKFIPKEGVEIRVDDEIDMRVRLIDCVGYVVDGAEGQMDYHFHGCRGHPVHNSGDADRRLWHEGIRGFAYGQFAEPGLLVGHGC